MSSHPHPRFFKGPRLGHTYSIEKQGAFVNGLAPGERQGAMPPFTLPLGLLPDLASNSFGVLAEISARIKGVFPIPPQGPSLDSSPGNSRNPLY